MWCNIYRMRNLGSSASKPLILLFPDITASLNQHEIWSEIGERNLERSFARVTQKIEGPFEIVNKDAKIDANVEKNKIRKALLKLNK